MAMERYGENEVIPSQVSDTIKQIFPKSWGESVPRDAGFELDQVKKLLAFVRDPCVKNPPSVKDLLRPLLSGDNWGEGARRSNMSAVRHNLDEWNKEVRHERLLSSSRSTGRHANDHHPHLGSQTLSAR